jgi:hypothetical protein
MDIIPCESQPGLTPHTSLGFCLILVDSFSRYAAFYGLLDKSMKSVVDTIAQYGAHYKVADKLDILTFNVLGQTQAQNLHQMSSSNIALLIRFSYLLPHLNAKTMIILLNGHGKPCSMLGHARLPDMYHFHAINYATTIFNVLPIQDLESPSGEVSTPFELFCGKKPTISHL